MHKLRSNEKLHGKLTSHGYGYIGNSFDVLPGMSTESR